MSIENVVSVLKRTYGANAYEDGLCVNANVFFDGEGITFRVTAQEGHRTKIDTDKSFGEWFDYVTFGTENYLAEIEKVCQRFGVEWDEEKQVLSITFRRNEMTMTDAFFRMTQAVMILGKFRDGIFFENREH